MFKLVNTCQNYLWGRKGGADNLVYQFFKAQDSSSQPNTDQPYAEYWMGCHPKSFSQVLVDGDKKIPVAQYLKDHHLEELPYLFKILSIADCLSLQAHPNKELAKVLHEKDPTNYPDANHKPEMCVALTDFRAFCNFCPKDELVANFKRYQCVYNLLKTQVDKLDQASEGDASKQAFKELFLSINDLPKSVIGELREEAKAKSDQTIREEVLAEIIATYPEDISVVSTLALNIIELGKGSAFVMNPHEPHSYIKGEIMEVMALSDNVVRLGLTPKFKDYDTLVQMLTWDMGKKDLVKPLEHSQNGLSYRTYMPAGYDEFQCVVIDGKIEEEKQGKFKTGFHAILANFGGVVEFSLADGKQITLQKHETLFVLKDQTVTFTSGHDVFMVICTKNGADMIKPE